MKLAGRKWIDAEVKGLVGDLTTMSNHEHVRDVELFDDVFQVFRRLATLTAR